MSLSRSLTLGGGGAGVTAATAAAIAAMAGAGTLTPGTIYFDAATGTHYFATSASTYAALGDGHFRGYGTIAQRTALSSPQHGDTYCSSDVGNRDVYWRYDSGASLWRPLNGSAMIGSLVQQLVAAPGNSSAFLIQSFTLPAGVWKAGFSLWHPLAAAKSGTADTLELSLRIGSAGAYTDNELFNSSALAAATDNLGAGSNMSVRVSATAVRRTGAGSISQLNTMGNSSTSAASDATVANLDSAANIISLWGKWTTGTAESVTVDLELMMRG